MTQIAQHQTHYGPSLSISKEIHSSKYRIAGESFIDCVHRFSSTLSDNDKHRQELNDILSEMRFLPAGRVQAAIGSSRRITPWNCFVSGNIADSFDDIMEKAKEAGHTMRLGGGIGYDFSGLRPRGALIKTLGAPSSGPIAFMDIYDTICGTISSAGNRRGAQMGVLRVDHPDIEEFIHAKKNNDRLTRFNVSVGVTDKFMKAVKEGSEFSLKWRGKTHSTVDARALWDTIMRSTWDWAEPGVLFIDRINEWNNLWYCETIAATNPCGEVPLPPYGACLLGSFNLVKYLDSENRDWFDFKRFRSDIFAVVRAMDNIFDIGTYPLPQQEEEGKSKRRMGLGVTGVANAIEHMGFPYGGQEFLEKLWHILTVLKNDAYAASVLLAKEKGAFPMYNEDLYLQGKFIQTLPSGLQKQIRDNGIRNSHLLSIAPTGTISLAADNISSGIEPVFTYEYQRKIISEEGSQWEPIQDYGFRVWGQRGRTADQVSVEEHVSVLTTAQECVDASVSKTCNVGPDVTWEDFKSVYIQAFEGGAKGVTTYRQSGKRQGIFKPIQEEKEYVDDEDSVEVCKIDPVTGAPTCS